MRETNDQLPNEEYQTYNELTLIQLIDPLHFQWVTEILSTVSSLRVSVLVLALSKVTHHCHQDSVFSSSQSSIHHAGRELPILFKNRSHLSLLYNLNQ